MNRYAIIAALLLVSAQPVAAHNKCDASEKTIQQKKGVYAGVTVTIRRSDDGTLAADPVVTDPYGQWCMTISESALYDVTWTTPRGDTWTRTRVFIPTEDLVP